MPNEIKITFNTKKIKKNLTVFILDKRINNYEKS